MTKFVALLRAVNLGSHQQIAMSALRDFAKDLGFRDVRTILQSGNLVFEAERLSAKGLENPFPDEVERAPGRLIVMFLKHSPNPSGLKALRDAIRGPEVVEIVGKQAYIVYPDGIGRSRLTNAAIEGKLGTRSTGRNWNTVLKIAALVNSQNAS